MKNFFNAIGNIYRSSKANNRKENKGRSYRKQYAPAYSAKQLKKMKEAGLPSYFIAKCARQKRLILHDVA